MEIRKELLQLAMVGSDLDTVLLQIAETLWVKSADTPRSSTPSRYVNSDPSVRRQGPTIAAWYFYMALLSNTTQNLGGYIRDLSMVLVFLLTEIS
jgi:hypothetical protein